MTIKSQILAVVSIGALFIVSGCATVTRGSNDNLQVVSQPPGAQVKTSNGYSCASTPCEMKIPRRSKFVVTISKPGCRTQQVKVTNELAEGGAAGVAGNVLIGGVIGMGVDAATGATQNLEPNPIVVNLKCR